MVKIDTTTQSVIFILAFALLFIYTTSPLSNLKEASLWNLLLLGSIGSFVLIASTNKQFLDWFRVKSKFEFLKDIQIGAILGIGITLIVSLMLSGLNAVYNLLQQIPYSALAGATTNEVVFVGLIQPLTETILMVSALLFFAEFFKRQRLPYSKFLSLVLVTIVFTGLHFAILGKGNYEYSFTGFFNFIGDTTNLGTAGYSGGAPILLLGLFWGILALTYKSYIVVWSAHTVNNLIALYYANLPPEALNLLAMIVLFFIVIVAFVTVKFGFKSFNEFNLQRIFEG